MMTRLIRFVRHSIADMRHNYVVYGIVNNHFPTAAIERNVYIKGDLKNLSLGDKVTIQSGTVLLLGGFEWCEFKGKLTIGDESVISPNCIIYAAGPGGVEIGGKFDCGPGVGIFASRTDYAKGIQHHLFAPVIIGHNVTVFANAVISPGVRIGDEAVIAACSVVTKDVPPRSLVGGAPAKIIRENIK
jgi:acetyltransferase-like isoleucine patch superfamily enzyme